MKLSDGVKSRIASFFLVFSLVFVRFCCFGFTYYYQLDDYIQHHNYAARDGTWDVIRSLGLLGARPLAGILDVTFWSRFFPCMILGILLIALLYAASACLLREVWHRQFGTGWVFLILYSILPLAMEGTYWMSASTRIVCGMFFAAASLRCFDTWCATGKRRALATYAVLQLISYGFYEQTLVFSITATFLVAFLHFQEHRKRSLWALLSLFHALLYFLFTGLFANSAMYGSRTEIALPTNAYYFHTFLPDVLSQMRDAFLGGGFYTLVKGFKRGFLLLFQENMWIYAIVLALLLLLLFFVVRRQEKGQSRRHGIALLFGFLLALAPVTPFFLLAERWFSLRGTVVSLCGLALMADTLWRLCVRRLRNGPLLEAGLVVLMAFTCCVASVSEMYDYRQTTENDTAVVSAIADRLHEDGYESRDLRIGILGVEASYLYNQNFFYHEHIHGVTESSWALSGMLEAVTGCARNVTPIPAYPMYRAWNRTSMLPETFDVLYYYDFESSSIQRIYAEKAENGTYTVRDEKNRYLGYIWEENNIGYFEKAD